MASNPDKIIPLYGGKVHIAFWEKMHWYRLWDAKTSKPLDWVTSVTSATGLIGFPSDKAMEWATGLTKIFLTELFDNKIKIAQVHIDEACRQHLIKKEEAASTGTQVHKYAEEFVKGLKPELPTEEKALNGVTAFHQWFKSKKIKILESERMVYSKKYNYVGTMDALAVIDGKTSVIDFKTSNYANSSMCYQVAAYQMAYEEEIGKTLSGARYLLRFDKDDGEFHPRILDVEETDYKEDCRAFIGLLDVKNRQKQRKDFWKEDNYEK